MKAKWNEMPKAEKIHYILSFILTAISLVFIVIDISTDWIYASLGWSISFGLYLALECKMNWNKNRKRAIIELVCGLLLIGVHIVTLFV